MVYMPDDLFEDMSVLTLIFTSKHSFQWSFDGLSSLKSLTLAGFLLLEELHLASLENLQSFTVSDRGAWVPGRLRSE
ncbi:hypothetical protein PHYSODRAFT_487014 [Phytophthora sojae]|uniref:Uncharacterized protein n=1 Tax=Phytophthora sojae (strain P6497) TaxID=1094619 RepID=G4YRS8_PHYSP|nr:hypothetical protein PHYSODRAFT_487014 [Phytophthora sojae]EGZ22905.1 hypothetical protein PHYSODRAFT_487014 [Phytophthora sojae]|eukprot:XP_009518193.1 hypothetical protein PHYSODRAFT_487014 [Phytophthora sojae]